VTQPLEILGLVLAGLALVGSGYAMLAADRIRRFRSGPPGEFGQPPAVSVLKPLHGAEPGLEAALASFGAQDYPGVVQIVLGLQDPADPAASLAQAFRATSRPHAVDVVVDPTPHGANAKVANLINLSTQARHDVLVLSDSDISVRPDYLRRVVSALEAPGAGVVTCPYYGLAVRGFWSRLAAMGVSYQFLPSVAVGVSLGLATPCMGSTIALRRSTLAAIGGFVAFADVLADDYAIGAAVRATGARSVVAPVLVAHGCAEASLAELVAHELRWARTVRGVDPAGFFGSAVTHPVPLALLACLLLGGGVGWAVLGVALAARFWLMSAVNRTADLPPQGWWFLPLRDVLSFGVFLGALLGRGVEWRGQRYQVDRHGVMSRS
jgi:ceramide glucosyltransferase